MKKLFGKAISVLLVAVMVLCAAPLAGFVGFDLPEINLFSTKAEAEEAPTSGTCGENLTWTLDAETGELIISGTGDMSNYIMDAPWKSYVSSIKSVTISDGVTSIGELAFYDCTSLESVTIPDSVTSIGDGGFFNCESLTNTIISNNVAFIGDYAFYNCESLTNIIISDNVEFIGDYAFSECYSLRSIIVDPANAAYSSDEYGVLFNKDKTELIQYPTGNLRKGYIVPDGVTNIGDSAFDDCNDIRSITIPDGVTNIGDSAFNSCDGLRSITIPDSVTSIGDDAFSWCYSLTNVYYTGTETEWNAISIGTSNHHLTGATIHYNCVEEILIASGICGENLIWEFYEPTGELVISGTGDMTDWSNHSATPWYNNYNFRTNIKTVTISNGVTSIGSYAFYECASLISVTIPDSVTSIGDSVFGECDSLTSIIVDSANTAYSSDEYGVLFNKDKTELIQYPTGNIRTSYTIPDSVKCVVGAFYGCVNLTSIEIPDSITSIDFGEFYGCFSLTSVTIPDTVTSIGELAFCECYRLTNVTIPKSVTSIGYGAFSDCYSLTDVYYTGTQAEWNAILIDSVNGRLTGAMIHYKHVHNYSLLVTKKPTCTEKGNRAFTCECGVSYTDKTSELGHDIIIDKTVDATCTETGLTEGQHCSRCDDVTVKQEIVPALNHKDSLIKVDAKAPTCTEIGWDAYEYCTACTYTTYEEKGALDHDIIIDKAVASTCTETGLTEGQHCSRCDDMTVAQEIVPVKPHNHIAKYDSAKHWEECACGSKINVKNHSFVGGNVCSCGFKRVVNSVIKIRNNNGSKTINYGEILILTAVVTDKFENAKIYWYVDGVKKGEGEAFNVNFENGTKVITAKLVDENGVVYENNIGNEISDSENVTVNGDFFQKLISFFKNLFGMNRTVVQSFFKVIY